MEPRGSATRGSAAPWGLAGPLLDSGRGGFVRQRKPARQQAGEGRFLHRAGDRRPGAYLRRGSGALALSLAFGVGLLVLDPGRAESPEPSRFGTIVLDPGHGGDDHGARSAAGLAEKKVVLDVALRAARQLRREGFEVVMTRDDDRTVSLEERVSIANEAGGQIFVSIHANAARPRGARGIETFFVSLEASDDAADELARAENQAFEGFGQAPLAGDDPLLAILGDLIATEHLHESSVYARMAQEELSAIDEVASRGVKQAPFVVLMGVQMPASLVEIGFLTNPQEEKELRSSRRRAAIADALVRSVKRFAERYDARRGVGAVSAGGGS